MPKEVISDILEEYSEHINNFDLPNVLSISNSGMLSTAVCAGWVLGSYNQYAVIGYLKNQLLAEASDDEYNAVINKLKNDEYHDKEDLIEVKINELMYKMKFADLQGLGVSGEIKQEDKENFIKDLFRSELYPDLEENMIKRAVDIVSSNLERGLIDQPVAKQIIEGVEILAELFNKKMTLDEFSKVGNDYLNRYEDSQQTDPIGNYKYYDDDMVLNGCNEDDQKKIESLEKEKYIKERAKRLIRGLGGVHKVLDLVKYSNGDYLEHNNQSFHKDDVLLSLDELAEMGLNNPLNLTVKDLMFEMDRLKTGLIQAEKDKKLNGGNYEGLVCFECQKTNRVYRYSLDDMEFILSCFDENSIIPENNLAI